MINTGFSKEHRIINRLILNSVNNQYDIGLFHGQTGISIVLALYANKKPEASKLESVADFIFTNVSDKIDWIKTPGLGAGISGITWAVEFLVQNNLMEGSANEMCREADNKLMECDIRRIRDMSLEIGLSGIWHNVRARIQGNYLRSEPLPFDTEYLNNWLIVLSKNSNNFEEDACMWLSKAINGNVITKPLSLSPFISSKLDLGTPGLHKGIAGYVYNKYILEK